MLDILDAINNQLDLANEKITKLAGLATENIRSVIQREKSQNT